MKKTLLIIIIFILLIASATYIVNSNSKTKNNVSKDNANETSASDKTPEISKDAVKIKAIDFKLQDLTGKEVALSDLQGKKVFLNFFATWCPPCKAEMPDIEKLYQESKNTDLIIIAINIGEDNNTVKSFINKSNYNFKVLLDADKKVAEDYNIDSIPTSFFIDKAGNIVDKRVGEMTIEDMKASVDKLSD